MSEHYQNHIQEISDRCKEVLAGYVNGELDYEDINDLMDEQQEGTIEHAAITMAVAVIFASGEVLTRR